MIAAIRPLPEAETAWPPREPKSAALVMQEVLGRYGLRVPAAESGARRIPVLPAAVQYDATPVESAA